MGRPSKIVLSVYQTYRLQRRRAAWILEIRNDLPPTQPVLQTTLIFVPLSMSSTIIIIVITTVIHILIWVIMTHHIVEVLLECLAPRGMLRQCDVVSGEVSLIEEDSLICEKVFRPWVVCAISPLFSCSYFYLSTLCSAAFSRSSWSWFYFVRRTYIYCALCLMTESW